MKGSERAQIHLSVNVTEDAIVGNNVTSGSHSVNCDEVVLADK